MGKSTDADAPLPQQCGYSSKSQSFCQKPVLRRRRRRRRENQRTTRNSSSAWEKRMTGSRTYSKGEAQHTHFEKRSDSSEATVSAAAATASGEGSRQNSSSSALSLISSPLSSATYSYTSTTTAPHVQHNCLPQTIEQQPEESSIRYDRQTAAAHAAQQSGRREGEKEEHVNTTTLRLLQQQEQSQQHHYYNKHQQTLQSASSVPGATAAIPQQIPSLERLMDVHEFGTAQQQTRELSRSKVNTRRNEILPTYPLNCVSNRVDTSADRSGALLVPFESSFLYQTSTQAPASCSAVSGEAASSYVTDLDVAVPVSASSAHNIPAVLVARSAARGAAAKCPCVHRSSEQVCAAAATAAQKETGISGDAVPYPKKTQAASRAGNEMAAVFSTSKQGTLAPHSAAVAYEAVASAAEEDDIGPCCITNSAVVASNGVRRRHRCRTADATSAATEAARASAPATAAAEHAVITAAHAPAVESPVSSAVRAPLAAIAPAAVVAKLCPLAALKPSTGIVPEYTVASEAATTSGSAEGTFSFSTLPCTDPVRSFPFSSSSPSVVAARQACFSQPQASTACHAASPHPQDAANGLAGEYNRGLGKIILETRNSISYGGHSTHAPIPSVSPSFPSATTTGLHSSGATVTCITPPIETSLSLPSSLSSPSLFAAAIPSAGPYKAAMLPPPPQAAPGYSTPAVAAAATSSTISTSPFQEKAERATPKRACVSTSEDAGPVLPVAQAVSPGASTDSAPTATTAAFNKAAAAAARLAATEVAALAAVPAAHNASATVTEAAATAMTTAGASERTQAGGTEVFRRAADATGVLEGATFVTASPTTGEATTHASATGTSPCCAARNTRETLLPAAALGATRAAAGVEATVPCSLYRDQGQLHYGKEKQEPQRVLLSHQQQQRQPGRRRHQQQEAAAAGVVSAEAPAAKVVSAEAPAAGVVAAEAAASQLAVAKKAAAVGTAEADTEAADAQAACVETGTAVAAGLDTADARAADTQAARVERAEAGAAGVETAGARAESAGAGWVVSAAETLTAAGGIAAESRGTRSIHCVGEVFKDGTENSSSTEADMCSPPFQDAVCFPSYSPLAGAAAAGTRSAASCAADASSNALSSGTTPSFTASLPPVNAGGISKASAVLPGTALRRTSDVGNITSIFSSSTSSAVCAAGETAIASLENSPAAWVPIIFRVFHARRDALCPACRRRQLLLQKQYHQRQNQCPQTCPVGATSSTNRIHPIDEYLTSVRITHPNCSSSRSGSRYVTSHNSCRNRRMRVSLWARSRSKTDSTCLERRSRKIANEKLLLDPDFFDCEDMQEEMGDEQRQPQGQFQRQQLHTLRIIQEHVGGGCATAAREGSRDALSRGRNEEAVAFAGEAGARGSNTAAAEGSRDAARRCNKGTAASEREIYGRGAAAWAREGKRDAAQECTEDILATEEVRVRGTATARYGSENTARNRHRKEAPATEEEEDAMKTISLRTTGRCDVVREGATEGSFAVEAAAKNVTLPQCVLRQQSKYPALGKSSVAASSCCPEQACEEKAARIKDVGKETLQERSERRREKANRSGDLPAAAKDEEEGPEVNRDCCCERLYVVGNHRLLGWWGTTGRGVTLTTSPSLYPYYISAPVLLPRHMCVVQYKFAQQVSAPSSGSSSLFFSPSCSSSSSSSNPMAAAVAAAAGGGPSCIYGNREAASTCCNGDEQRGEQQQQQDWQQQERQQQQEEGQQQHQEEVRSRGEGKEAMWKMELHDGERRLKLPHAAVIISHTFGVNDRGTLRQATQKDLGEALALCTGNANWNMPVFSNGGLWYNIESCSSSCRCYTEGFPTAAKHEEKTTSFWDVKRNKDSSRAKSTGPAAGASTIARSLLLFLSPCRWIRYFFSLHQSECADSPTSIIKTTTTTTSPAVIACKASSLVQYDSKGGDAQDSRTASSNSNADVLYRCGAQKNSSSPRNSNGSETRENTNNLNGRNTRTTRQEKRSSSRSPEKTNSNLVVVCWTGTQHLLQRHPQQVFSSRRISPLEDEAAQKKSADRISVVMEGIALLLLRSGQDLYTAVAGACTQVTSVVQ